MNAENIRPEMAGRAFQQALEIHREVRNRPFEGAEMCDYALFAFSAGKIDEARERWQRGAAILREVASAGRLKRTAAERPAACERAGVPPFDLPAPWTREPPELRAGDCDLYTPRQTQRGKRGAA